VLNLDAAKYLGNRCGFTGNELNFRPYYGFIGENIAVPRIFSGYLQVLNLDTAKYLGNRCGFTFFG